jgi:hypothetical protein
LLSQDTIENLFKHLEEAEKTHGEGSLLQKGFKVMKPRLEQFKFILDLVTPFASMQPAVGTPLGLVKGVTAVS